MIRILLVVLIAFGAWKGYELYQAKQTPAGAQVQPLVLPTRAQPSSASFKCDGRKHCSQMTSCAEATYFLRNCPGVKMDGNNDGVPCEQQWCK